MSAEQSNGHDRSSAVDEGLRAAWYRPLGSATAARYLADLVAERSVTVAPPGVAVDIDRGVVSHRDRSWSAPLAPLAARVAGIDPSGWAVVVDHEITRWCRVAVSIGRAGARDVTSRPPRAVVRLTSERNAVGATLRPAFGDVKWEILRDLGPDGVAAIQADPAQRPAINEQTWRRTAAATVDRHHHRWARLTLDSGRGLMLSGPRVSALLFEPGRLIAAIGQTDADHGRVTVFSNALLLIRFGAGDSHPAAGLLVKSLEEFTAGCGRSFEPFTITIDGIA